MTKKGNTERTESERRKAVEDVLENIRGSVSVELSCAYVKISKSTFYRYINEFKMEEELAKAHATSRRNVRGLVYNTIMKNKDAHLGLKWLELQDPDFKKHQVNENIEVAIDEIDKDLEDYEKRNTD